MESVEWGIRPSHCSVGLAGDREQGTRHRTLETGLAMPQLRLVLLHVLMGRRRSSSGHCCSTKARAMTAALHLHRHRLSRITPCLYLSDGMAAGNAQLLAANRITTIINVSLELANMFHPGIDYLRIPVADTPTARISACFNSVADLIRSVGERGGRTLVHCAAGVSRSATVCIAYLMKHHAMSLASAHAWVRSCRPIIRPNNGFWRQLIHYEYLLFGINTVHMVHSPFGMIPDIYEREARMMF
ncbi:dual specificity protein phosphatase 18 isoform X1 [Phasianus colchicus]|uniref:dual specificity protein phosphatase 18 isoform X1 n=2 Tax=Phasianus colchicus TaxID=9054 RepID=UPI00129DFF5B|nr:dual specificity protein phosphatase 18 isoform X1 [Phasianus colchicus]